MTLFSICSEEFLRYLTGWWQRAAQEQSDDGQVTIDPGMIIGYFSQEVGERSDKSAVAAVMEDVGPVSELIVERARLATPPASA